MTMDLLGREVLRDDPGQQALLDRLLDVALVQVLREHLTRARDVGAGVVPRVGRPARGLGAARGPRGPRAAVDGFADLAAEAALSRSTFARRFTELLGMGPLAYLTDWRMALARERLRDTDERLAAVAQSLGYASEFAFAAAFSATTARRRGAGRASARAATAGPHRALGGWRPTRWPSPRPPRAAAASNSRRA